MDRSRIHRSIQEQARLLIEQRSGSCSARSPGTRQGLARADAFTPMTFLLEDLRADRHPCGPARHAGMLVWWLGPEAQGAEAAGEHAEQAGVPLQLPLRCPFGFLDLRFAQPEPLHQPPVGHLLLAVDG